jgi:hypothetical protein
MVGWLGCTTSGKGEVDGNSSRIHLGKAERRPVAKGRGREEF